MNSFFLAEIDFAAMLPFAVFGAVAAAIWFVADTFFFNKTKTEERLERMANLTPVSSSETSSSQKSGLGKMLEQHSESLAKPLQPKSEKEQGKIRERLDFAGYRSEESIMVFLASKFVFCAVGLVLGGGASLLMTGFSIQSLTTTFLFGGVFFFAPDLLLVLKAKKRQEKIFLGLPDALDLLTVCVEAGLGLDQAMRKVADEIQKSQPVLSHEFAISNMQVQMGRARDEVYTELGKRNGVEDLQTLASSIVQTDKLGSSISRALRVQSDAMRTRRRQIAEEKAAKTAVKLIFPLVIFIFPGIFVVLVGPAAITMINEMLPAFQK